jgi:hypothetical protein
MSSRRYGIPILLAGTATCVLMLGACDGPNQFGTAGPGGFDGTGAAPEVEIQDPRGDSLSARPVGDSVLVRARIQAGAGISEVTFDGFSLRGDPDLGTQEEVSRFESKTVTLESTTDTVISRYLLPTEDEVPEAAFIEVKATDADGEEGADTVRLILGGPSVQLLDLEEGQQIQSGLGLNLATVVTDPQGIIEVSFDLQGIVDTTLVRVLPTPVDSIRVDTTLAIPAGASGALSVAAVARNTVDISGGAGPLGVSVVTGGAADQTPPQVRLQFTALQSLELKDSLSIQVVAQDNPQGSGLVEMGYTVRAVSVSRGDTLVQTDFTTFTPPRTGTLSREFRVPIFNVDSLALPDTLIYEATAFALDQSGNCAAAVGDEPQSLDCEVVAGALFAEGRTGSRLQRPHVSGRTVLLPEGGQIVDAAVDYDRRNLFLSNFSRNRVEVFRLGSETFGTPIRVGSEPWGLAFNRAQDSLWVANSGGTNFSVVDLATELEMDSVRFLTPDVALFEAELNEDDGTYSFFFLPGVGSEAFSDRPQFVAVDSFGSLIYSTRTTPAGDLGTARKAFYPTGGERSEVKIFIDPTDAEDTENFWAFAHIDGIGGGDGNITLFDHVPGFPNDVITGSADIRLGQFPVTAADALRAQGSDVLMVPSARWNTASLGYRDTTYVSASGDGGWVAIGEGGASPLARVLMYRAAPGDATNISGGIEVTDLLNNAAEQVLGLGMNHDGTLTVVRGIQAAYFISPDLRLQGQTSIPLATSGSGAAMHPLHADVRTLQNPAGGYRPDTHLAFVGTGERTIDVIDTQGFLRIGRVAIRDVITGPLRAVLPFPGDNAGFQCQTQPVTDQAGTIIGDAVQIYLNGNFETPIPPDGITEDACIVLKLFGTTSAGGVVVVDVRKADILREHPARQ